MSESAPLESGAEGLPWQEDESLHRQVQLEEEFTHQAAAFRHDFFAVIQKYFNAETARNWAYYTVPSKLPPGEPARFDTNREILVLTHFAQPSPFPVIRIITNEFFGTAESGNFLTEDFILDHENDSQYFIDAADITDSQIKPNLSPIFILSDGEPQLFNCHVFPPSLRVHFDEKDPRSVVPFGYYKNIQDKLGALQFGRDLLTEITNAEPTAWTPTP